MTPDGSYFLSVFENEREISVWNNFLGVVPTSEAIETLRFSGKITKLPSNLRQFLNGKSEQHTYSNNVY